MKSKQIELCGWLKYGLNIPMYQPYIKIYQDLFPGLIHECPYKVIFKLFCHLNSNFKF